jgi:hypothetical protein
MIHRLYLQTQPVITSAWLVLQRFVQEILGFIRRHPPSVGLLFWSGCFLVFVGSVIPREVAGSAPTQRNIMYGRLTSEHQYSQTFQAEAGTLIGIRVLLFPPANPSDDLVTLRLSYDTKDLPEIAVVSLPLSGLNSYGMTVFAIEPFSVTTPESLVTSTLRLDIEAPTLPANHWISVVAGPNTYAGGQLFVDNKPRPKYDLAFQPIYRATWLDRWIPVSRIAQGKPGFLAYPVVYALFSYICVFLIGLILIRLWRIARSTND